MANEEQGLGIVADVDEFVALKASWSELPTAPKVTTAAECETHRVAGYLTSVLLRGEESAGRMGVFEMYGRRGAIVPPHHQTDEEEYFYIVQGEWEFQINDETVRVGPGSFLFAPRGVKHAFQVISDEGKLVSWNSPAGHERFFVEMVPLIEAGRMNDVVEKAPKYQTVF